MLQTEYKQEMERLGPPPEVLDQLYTQIAQGGTQMRHVKRIGRQAVILFAVCAALLMTAVAAGPGIWAAVQARMGAFAPYAQAIEGVVCQDQGIEVRVVAALSDDVQGKLYFTVRDLTGDRINEFLSVNGRLEVVEEDKRDLPVGIVGTTNLDCSALSYDPETKTALFCREILYGDGHPLETAAINLRAMSTKTGDLSASVSASTVTEKTLASQPIPADAKVYPERHNGKPTVILAPNQTPMALEGTEDFTVSSLGFASDGCLHLRLSFAPGVSLLDEERFSPILANIWPQDMDLHSEQWYTLQIVCADTWADIQFPLITPAELEILKTARVGVYNPYHRPGVDIQGAWTLTFPMEYHPSQVLDWTGALAGRQVERVTLSPFTVTMDSNDKGGLNSAALYAVLKDGSTVAAKPSVGRYANVGALEGGADVWKTYNSWAFDSPVDPDQVVSLTLLGETIPVR